MNPYQPQKSEAQLRVEADARLAQFRANMDAATRQKAVDEEARELHKQEVEASLLEKRKAAIESEEDAKLAAARQQQDKARVTKGTILREQLRAQYPGTDSEFEAALPGMLKLVAVEKVLNGKGDRVSSPVSRRTF